MLLDPVLDDLRAMADIAQVRVNPFDHLVGPVAELARDSVYRDRRAAVERLQPGGAVGMAEGLRAELACAEAGSLRDAIEQSVDVPEPPLLAASGPRGHEEGSTLLQPRPNTQARRMASSCGHIGITRCEVRLERAPAVGPNRDRPPVKGDVVELQPGDLPEPAPGQEEQGDQDVRVGRIIDRLGGSLLPAEDPSHDHVRDTIRAPSGPQRRELPAIPL